jgi:K(+)-stimulated pyrophosphate-energized sodium pump
MSFSLSNCAQACKAQVMSDSRCKKIAISGLVVTALIALSVNLVTALAFAASIAAIIYGILSIAWINQQSPGNERMVEIASAIQQGAKAYLNRQYKTIGIVGAVLFFLIGIALGWPVAWGFAIGAVLSGAAGYIGMNISVRSNCRTAQAASEGMDAAFGLAFRGGAITGMLVVGLGLLGVSGYYTLLKSQIGRAHV